MKYWMIDHYEDVLLANRPHIRALYLADGAPFGMVNWLLDKLAETWESKQDLLNSINAQDKALRKDVPVHTTIWGCDEGKCLTQAEALGAIVHNFDHLVYTCWKIALRNTTAYWKA